MLSQGSVLPALSCKIVCSPTALLLHFCGHNVVHFLSEWIWSLRRPLTSLCAVGGGSLHKGTEKTDKQTHQHGEWESQKSDA